MCYRYQFSLKTLPTNAYAKYSQPQKKNAEKDK